MHPLLTSIEDKKIILPDDFTGTEKKEVVLIFLEDIKKNKLKSIREQISKKIPYSSSKKLIEERG